MYFFAPAIGTDTLNNGVSAGVFAAARTVIAARAAPQLVPAVFAQILIGLTNASLTVDAHCRPEKLVQTLQGKRNSPF